MAPCVVLPETLEHDIVILHIKGSLVYEDVQTVSAQARQAFMQGYRRIILDVAELESVNSKGLGAIVGIQNGAQDHHGKMVIWNPTEDLLGHLKLTKLTDILTIVTGDLIAAIIAVTEEE